VFNYHPDLVLKKVWSIHLDSENEPIDPANFNNLIFTGKAGGRTINNLSSASGPADIHRIIYPVLILSPDRMNYRIII